MAKFKVNKSRCFPGDYTIYRNDLLEALKLLLKYYDSNIVVSGDTTYNYKLLELFEFANKKQQTIVLLSESTFKTMNELWRQKKCKK